MSPVLGEVLYSAQCQVVIADYQQTHTLEVSADCLVAPLSRKVCPYCHTHPVAIISRSVDQETGNEIAHFRCTIGDEWYEPTRTQYIRSIGYGQEWRRFGR